MEEETVKLKLTLETSGIYLKDDAAVGDKVLWLWQRFPRIMSLQGLLKIRSMTFEDTVKPY